MWVVYQQPEWAIDCVGTMDRIIKVILRKSFIYQLMYNRVTLKEY
jgi:hypothetical protein